MNQVFALVDYDNVRPNKREASAMDVKLNLSVIAAEIVSVAKLLQVLDVSIRLYGGWITQRGHYSGRAQWLLASMSSVRGLRLGVRVRPTLVTALAGVESVSLIGTFRNDRSPPVQKMVDTMITVDALHLSNSHRVLVVSDDDDLTPAALYCATNRVTGGTLLRCRPEGAALNDSSLSGNGVMFYLAKWG